MKHRFFAAVLTGLLVFGGGHLFANRDQNMEPAEMFFLPKGDAAAGRKAFKDINCLTCHHVAGDPEFTAGSGLGPVLGPKQADYAAGWIANSIVSPSHTIALEAEDKGDEVPSLMGDFTDKMTVKQMIDLVAYIKSLKTGEETASAEEKGGI